MFFPGHSKSSLRSKAVKDQGQRQLTKTTGFFSLVSLVQTHIAENAFRNNPA